MPPMVFVKIVSLIKALLPPPNSGIAVVVGSGLAANRENTGYILNNNKTSPSKDGGDIIMKDMRSAVGVKSLIEVLITIALGVLA